MRCPRTRPRALLPHLPDRFTARLLSTHGRRLSEDFEVAAPFQDVLARVEDVVRRQHRRGARAPHDPDGLLAELYRLREEAGPDTLIDWGDADQEAWELATSVVRAFDAPESNPPLLPTVSRQRRFDQLGVHPTQPVPMLNDHRGHVRVRQHSAHLPSGPVHARADLGLHPHHGQPDRGRPL